MTPVQPPARRPLQGSRLPALLAVLLASTLAALGLQLVRQAWTGQGRFWSITWDLFLAWVPLAFAIGLSSAHGRSSRNGFWMGAMGLLWLLFFPNAPYLLTEFVHLGPHRSQDPIWWCDLVVILMISWDGALLGFVSLRLVQRVVRALTNPVWSWVAVVVCLALGSFGITLGRFQRLNSWDALALLRPRTLLRFLREFADPHTFGKNIGLAALLAGFLIMAYVALVALMAVGQDEPAMPARKDS